MIVLLRGNVVAFGKIMMEILILEKRSNGYAPCDEVLVSTPQRANSEPSCGFPRQSLLDKLGLLGGSTI